MTRLLCIPISHYCERARWALDHAGVAYTEEHHLQALHYRPVKQAGGRDTVPVLITDSGEVLDDSADIVRWAAEQSPADRPLYPAEAEARAAIEAQEAAWSAGLGVESRRVIYHFIFRWGRPALRYNAGRAPLWQRALLQAGFGPAKRFIIRKLEITPETAARGLERVREAFDEVATRLADGRAYLFGDAFTAGDLTFATMAAPVLLPEPYGTPLPRPEVVPDELKTLVEGFRDHPAGRFALRMFAEHRLISTGDPAGH